MLDLSTNLSICMSMHHTLPPHLFCFFVPKPDSLQTNQTITRITWWRYQIFACPILLSWQFAYSLFLAKSFSSLCASVYTANVSGLIRANHVWFVNKDFCSCSFIGKWLPPCWLQSNSFQDFRLGDLVWLQNGIKVQPRTQRWGCLVVFVSSEEHVDLCNDVWLPCCLICVTETLLFVIMQRVLNQIHPCHTYKL